MKYLYPLLWIVGLSFLGWLVHYELALAYYTAQCYFEPCEIVE